MLGIELILLLLLVGGFVGFMAGLLGIGGGGMLVPILTSIFLSRGAAVDKVVHLALGTAMATMIVTTFSSFRAHASKRNVIWKVARGMSVGIILGTFLATFIASHLKSFYLAVFFSLFMAYVAGQMYLDKKPKPSRELAGNAGLFLAGAAIGAISALVSIGGGALTVPYLTWQNVDIKKAIGTSAAIGFPIAIAGTIGYLVNGRLNTSTGEYTFGFIYLPAALIISATSFFAAPFGAQLSHKLPVPILKKVFAALLLGLSVKMLMSVL